MTFRVLTEADEPLLQKFVAETKDLAQGAPDEWHSAIVNGRIMVAVEKDLLAFVVVSPMGNGEAEILQLATHRSARRKGIMRQLIQKTVNHFQIKTLHLEVRATNHAALKLYNAIGLKPVGLRKAYYPDGEDAILFSGSFELA